MELSTPNMELQEYIKSNINKNNLVLAASIFILSISLALGIGYVLGKGNNPAPIIIQQSN